ncbi:MAG: hypothetical protein HC884_16430 [Chloroflexaceae bacterium]|nr:hypothetical protein [Chloroflexaceae bacterium]
MSAVSYARPRLTTAQDKRYRAHVEQFLLQRKNQRAIRPPRQRDIFGGQAEEALRAWLGEHYSLSDRRILEYEQRQGRRAHTRYRELDAVVIEDKRSVRVFEIKASRVARSLRRAVAQLQETRAIIRLLYPTVSMTILLVDTGIPTAEEVEALMHSAEAPEHPPETLAGVLEALESVHPITSLDEQIHDGTTINVLTLSVDRIIELAGAENLALDWSDDDEDEETPPPPPDPGPVYSSSSDNEDEAGDGEGSLAEALRRVGLGS